MYAKDFKGNDPRWLYHLFETIDLSGYDSGSVQPMLNRNYIAAVPVWVPPLAEQQAIAEVLGALDDKIAANVRLARTLYSLVEADFVRTSARAKHIRELSDLATTQYGLTTSASSYDGVCLLRVTDINKQPWIDWDGVPGCTVSEPERAKYILQPGDIVVARMADPGKCAWIAPGDPDTVFASYLVRLRVHDPNHAPFVFQFLRSPTYVRYADGVGQGSVQKNMNAKAMVATQITLPEPPVLEAFSRRFHQTWQAMTSVLGENRTLAATRDALLPQLMSGKLRVRDAEAAASAAGA